MITNICYYLFATSCWFSAACGLYYMYDRRNAKLLTYRIGWKGLEYYTRCKTYYNINIHPLFFEMKETKDKEEEEEAVSNQLILHNIETDKYETYVEVPDGIEYDWLVVKKYSAEGVKYKVVEDIEKYEKNEKNETNVEINYNPFLQIEIEQDGKNTDIQDNLDFFFLEENKILDKTFLMWYLKFFYDCDLKDDYKLHIIDSNVNVIILDNKQHIMLGKNNYIIKDN